MSNPRSRNEAQRTRDAWERAHDPDDPIPSVLPKAIHPDRNPVLQRDFRIPFHQIRAIHVGPAVLEILSRGQAAVQALATDKEPPSWENTVARLDRIGQDVGESLNPVVHLLSVAETPELREAYNTVLPEITQFWSRLSLNPELWARLKEYAETPEARGLTGLRARHLDKTLREFRRAGADLPPDKKTRLEEIRLELARLQRKFEENVLDATAAFELHLTDEERLDGIPRDARARFRAAAREKEMEGWLLTLDYPSYEAVLKHARDRGLREEVHRAYVSRCRQDAHDNVPLLPRMLSLRHELARILGHRHFPDYRLDDAMAKSGDAASAFEADLVRRTRPYWERDLAQLRDHARRLGISDLLPWDVPFVAESLRKERYDIDDELLRPWFPLEGVLAGLFELVKRVFGLTVTQSSNDAVWHPDVRFYDVRDERGTWLGSFYTDWFPRKEKRQGAWMNDFLTGGPTPEGGFLPHLGFIAGNFSPPLDGRPSLLTHRDVQTVFHEFGHLLHHLTSRVPIAGRGGLNVAWDWVELPSQLMENWTWEQKALDLFARHHQTGEPLPRDILERLRAGRRFQGGWQQMRQLSFGTLDLQLHGVLAPTLSGKETGQEVMDFAEETLLPFSPDMVFARSHILPTFTHIFGGGYAAGYYSYLWSEVLEADAFTRFQREGILSRSVGQAYLDAILSRGDSAEPQDLFREFMGREPDPQALLERNLGPPPV